MCAACDCSVFDVCVHREKRGAGEESSGLHPKNWSVASDIRITLF